MMATRADWRISSASNEFIRVRVNAKESGVVVNPTTDAVSFAFPSDAGAPGAFTAGSWETDATTTPDTYYARIRVGGTGSGATKELANGNYHVYVKITDSPEVPVLLSGTLVVF